MKRSDKVAMIVFAVFGILALVVTFALCCSCLPVGFVL